MVNHLSTSLLNKLMKLSLELGVGAYAYDLSTWDVEEDLEFRVVCAYIVVQPGLYETLSKQNKTTIAKSLTTKIHRSWTLASCLK